MTRGKGRRRWLTVVLLAVGVPVLAVLWVFAALFYPVVCVGGAVAAALAAWRGKRGKRLATAFALLSGVTVAVLVGTFTWWAGAPCPQESASLTWVDRSGPAYDALWQDEGVVIGRRRDRRHSGLIVHGKNSVQNLAPAHVVQGLLGRGGRLLAADWAGSALWAVSGERHHRLPVCRWPIDLAMVPDGALVLCEGDDRLLKVTGWPPQVAKSYPLPTKLSNPYGLAVSRDGQTAYVSNWGPSGGVAAVTLATGVTRLHPTPGSAMGLVVLPDRDELWVAEPLAGKVRRYGLAPWRVLGDLPTDLGTRRLAVSDGVVGAVNYFDGTFQAWDADTLEEVLHLPVGKLARGVRPAPGGFLVCTGCGVGRVVLEK